MRLLERDKKTLFYCLYVRSEPVKDEYGNETGDKRVVYAPAVAMRASISAAVGQAQIELFGNFSSYDRVIITDDPECPITEESVLFVGKEPEYDEKGTPLYNYQVRRRAESPDGSNIAYAISEVRVS